MELLNLETGESFEAEILLLEEKEYSGIKRSKRFEFDWSKEKENYVYKIVRKEKIKNRKIHGLLSITNRSDEFRIHINLIENSNSNKGKKKRIDNVAGCLLAFSCQLAFENGYYGFVSLVPKTVLIKLYVKKYGFSQFGRELGIEGREAIKLIQKYL